jgi:hypothetical protein
MQLISMNAAARAWTVAIAALLMWSSNNKHAALAFPDGAGGCASIFTNKVGAVGGSSHVDTSNGKNVTAVTPAVAQLKTQIDGVQRPEAPLPITAGKTYTLSFESPVIQYKGLLLRMAPFDIPGAPVTAGADATGAFTAFPAGYKAATVCTGTVAGLTHTDASLKRSMTTTFQLNNPGTYTLEVNVVFANNATLSLFTLDIAIFQVSAAGPTAPVTAPVTAPRPAPVTAPVPKPVTAPVTAPVPAPVPSPVTAPVAKPTNMPMLAEPMTISPAPGEYNAFYLCCF